MKNKKIIVGLSIIVPMLILLLEYYIIGPLLADGVSIFVAQCSLLALSVIFMIAGIVILVRASGGYKFCCVPSIVASLLLVFGYFLSEAVKEIWF